MVTEQEPQSRLEITDGNVTKPADIPADLTAELLDPPLTPELRREILASLDLLNSTLDIDITLSGKSNVGKNSTADELAEILGVEHWDGSKQLWRRTDEPESGVDKNSIQAHAKFDEGLRKEFGKLRSRRKRKKVFQTRLAGIDFKEASDERDLAIHNRRIKIARARQRGRKPLKPISEIKAISVLLTATDHDRLERAYGDFKRKGIPETQWPSKPDLRDRITQRDYDNLSKWRAIHPTYLGEDQDPFDPNLTRPNGFPVYDMVVDTSGLTPREVALTIIKRLKEEFNAFRQVSESQEDKTPSDQETSRLEAEQISSVTAVDLEPNRAVVLPAIRPDGEPMPVRPSA